jgi:hypothetical protein
VGYRHSTTDCSRAPAVSVELGVELELAARQGYLEPRFAQDPSTAGVPSGRATVLHRYEYAPLLFAPNQRGQALATGDGDHSVARRAKCPEIHLGPATDLLVACRWWRNECRVQNKHPHTHTHPHTQSGGNNWECATHTHNQEAAVDEYNYCACWVEQVIVAVQRSERPLAFTPCCSIQYPVQHSTGPL